MRLEKQNRVLVIQHAACEGPGIFGQALREAGISTHCINVANGDAVPSDPAGYSGLIILGGPMAVYERHRHPFLRDELNLIEKTLHANLPLIGICLGCQLLCTALGGEVSPGNRKEIGWHEVELSAAARSEKFFNNHPRRFVTFHWHGDQCSLPAYSTLLASSAITEVQAFSYGVGVLGIQFHPEADRDGVHSMCEAFADELALEGINPVGIMGGAELHLPATEALTRGGFAQWWNSAAGAKPLIFEHGEPASD